jgi:hypothetical protein
MCLNIDGSRVGSNAVVYEVRNRANEVVSDVTERFDQPPWRWDD